MERDEIDRIIRMTKTMFERWEQRIEALFEDNDMRLCRPSEKPKGDRRKGIRRYQDRLMYPESKNKRHLKDRRKGKEVNPQFHERTKHEPVDFKTSWAVKEGVA